MNTSRAVLACLAAASVCLLPGAVRGQTLPTFSSSITESSELIELVGTTHRIGRAEIEARHARTLDEVLKWVPGVYVRTGGDGSPRVDIRGFRSRHVLLLINGVPVNSTADGQFDPARISTKAIREVKVSYGSSSVLYGDNALAGVIEVTTVDGRPDANVELHGGTPDQWGAGGRLAHTTGPWAVMGAGTVYSTTGFRLPTSFAPTSTEDGERRENSDRDRWDVRAGLAYKFSESASVSTEWTFGNGVYGLPPGTVNDPSDIFAQIIRYERVEDYRMGSGQVSALLKPWPRFNLRAWVYRNAQREDRARFDDATYTSMDDALVAGTFQSRERTAVTGSTALGRVDLQRFGWLRVALNQRRESFVSDGVIRDVPVASSGGGGGGGGGGGRGGGNQPVTPPTFAVRTFSLDEHVDVYSTGTEWQVHPIPKVGVVLGGAANWQRRTDSSVEMEPTFIAGASYEATTSLRVHASATSKIRVPSLDQLYNPASGNPDLRPERANGVEVGVDQQLGGASTIGVSAFATHAHDFIERIGSTPFENQDQYQFTGVEVTGRTGVIARVTLDGAYSFLDAVNATPGAANARLQTRPRHRGTLQWEWKPLPASAVRGAAQYVGRQLYDARGSNPIQVPASPYALLDLGFTQVLARRYEVAFDVTNVFDHLYDQAYGLPREGRTALLTLRVRMD